jgi:protein gp37
LERSAKNWNEPLKWEADAAKDGKRHLVFCASLADVFEQLPPGHPQLRWMDEQRERLWALVDRTPHLTWLLLTKRPYNVLGMVPDTWLTVCADHDCEHVSNPDCGRTWPRNVWVGTTVEDQRRLDERIHHLAAIPARVRFLSMEPLLEAISFRPKAENPIDMTRLMDSGEASRPALLDGIHWVIVGGESGPGCRLMEREWVRGIFTQARQHHSPPALFYKQEGGHPDKRHDIAQFPPDLQIREWPKVTP